MIAAELFKMRTTRTFYGLVAACLGLVLVIVILVTALVNFSPDDEPLEDMLGVTGFVQPFALVLGILAVTSEFRHGTVTPSLLVTPNRVKLTLAKLVASVLISLLLGLIATVLVTGIVKVIGGARDLDTSGDAGAIIIGATLATGLWGALGVGLGAIVRNQVGALIGGLVYVFVLENLIGIIPKVDDVVPKYGLNGVSSGLSGFSDSGDVLDQLPAGLLFAAYTAVFVIAGIAVMRQRDVTA
jgi:ABC-2 type transport system permease protein